MTISEKALKSINSLNDLLEFLGTELGWEINLEELDKAMYRFSPEELGVPDPVAEKIKSIKQLKPATTGQPWGIFLLDLSGVALSKKAVREVLKRLTSKGRGLKNPGLWSKRDLLFLVSSGAGDKTEIHLLTFHDREHSEAEILSIDWKPKHMTPLYLKTLRTELLPKLIWPKDNSQNEVWRESWSKAFFLKPGQSMKDADSLVERMAQAAISLRKAIESSLRSVKKNMPLTNLMAEIKSELVTNVDESSFADMCAQTVIYGLLAARVQNPEGFGASPLINELPLENDFLESIFQVVQIAISSVEKDEKSLQDLYTDLKATNVENILIQFGNTADGGDPVIHFYESFLARYDARQKIQTGSFYTPKRLVDGMVGIVDGLLKSKFNMPLGLADDATWKDVADHLGISVPRAVKPDSKFLSILDPATGTGTYLVSLFDRAKNNLEGAGFNKEDVKEKMVGSFSNSLKAFELMLAPYSIANLKMGMKYSEFEEPNKKNIFLANTLETGLRRLVLFAHDEPSPISTEGEKVLQLKREEPFTLIIGNPPYGVDSTQSAGSGDGNRFGEEMRSGDPEFFTNPPISDFTKALQGYTGNLPPLTGIYNLYAYFWRWAIWQTIQKPIHYKLGSESKTTIPISTSPGIVSFITSRSFVDTPTFAGFRRYLRENFDEIQVIDLGGDSMSAIVDENVFPIKTGVAVMTAVRYRSDGGSQGCEVRYVRLEGTKVQKLQAFSDLEFTDGTVLQQDKANMWANFKLDPVGLTSKMKFLEEFFMSTASGCLPRRTWASGPTMSILKNRWRKLLAAETNEQQDEFFKSKKNFNPDSRKSSLFNKSSKLTPIRLLPPNANPEKYSPYSYRPFDNQFVISDGRVVSGAARQFWAVESENNFWFGSGKNLAGGPSVFIYPHVPDFDGFKGWGGGTDFSPAYLDVNCTSVNLSSEAVLYASSFNKKDPARAFWGYLYGLHGSGAYYETFEDELRDNPERARLPLTQDYELFGKISDIGLRLMSQQLGDRLQLKIDRRLNFFICSPATIEASPNTIKYNKVEEAIYFDGKFFCAVPKEIWEFRANKLHVVKAWLENRKASPKGKRSSPLDDINETRWAYNDEFKKMIADVSAVIEAKKLVMPLMEQLVEELKNQPGK